MRRLLVTVATAALLGSGLGVAAEAAPAELRSVSGGASERALQAAFTPDKIAEVIRTAKPVPIPTDTRRPSSPERPGQTRTVAEPQAPTVASADAVNLTVSNAHGRLYIVNPDGSNYGWCSASVVASGARNLVHTAAHCVHGGPGQTWLFSSAFFVPAKNGPSEPFGVFWAAHWTVWNAWINDLDWDKDYSFINLYPRDGHNVQDYVGGNGLLVNASYSQTAVIWGYPAEAPYPGDVPYSCDQVKTYKDFLQNDIKANCGMVPGASGGPWLVNYNYGNGLGYLNGITSRVNKERTTIRASYFNDSVLNLYSEVD